MAVTPADVKKLRDKTDAGMLDCKKALVACNGDFAAAEKHLKEQGLASANKRSERATNAGAVFTNFKNGTAAMVELTCETDFVAKTDQFRATGAEIAELVAEKKISSVNDDLELKVKEAIAILKENMTIRKIILVDYSENDAIIEYQHNGGAIGVMVKLSCDSANTAGKDEVKALGFDLALHAAAYNPTYLNKDAVDEAYINEQNEIFTKQAENLGKPEKVLKGIVAGKMKKHLAQVCFVEQAFVKDDKISCGQAVANCAKAVGGEITLSDYKYIMVGTGE